MNKNNSTHKDWLVYIAYTGAASIVSTLGAELVRWGIEEYKANKKPKEEGSK